MSETIFSRLIDHIDLRNINRSAWQNAVTGQERFVLQSALLELAQESFEGTELDLLGIYKAAHAVLPLQGDSLIQLAFMLAEHPNEIRDWLDVFVEALAQPELRNSALPGRVLEILYDYLNTPQNGASEDPKFISTCRNLYFLGYQAGWMVDLLRKTGESY
jgi:hypothetical protein